MRGRGLVWGGAVVAVGALAGLGVYLARVGLQEADQLASVLGLFVAVAGLGVAVWGLIAGRRAIDVDQQVEAGGNSEAYQAGRDINEHLAGQPMPAGEASTDNPAGREQPRVRQQAKATNSGKTYQAGRDINKR